MRLADRGGEGNIAPRDSLGDYPDLHILLCRGRPGVFAHRAVPPAVLACLTKPVSMQGLGRLLRELGVGPG